MESTNVILIDADIVSYRASASCEPTKTRDTVDGLDVAIARVDETMHRILADCESDQYMAFLTGGENFRYKIYPEYKAHRRDRPPPRWWNDCKEYLVTEWKSAVCTGYEADDAIGIAASEYPNIIASIDKDLRQIPGRHYDFVKREQVYVSPKEAKRNFYRQMILGDRSDNIPKIPKIGEVGAERFLDQNDPENWEHLIKQMYEDYGMDFELNKKLLYILRTKEELANILCESEGEETPTVC
ncbi:hypothetical protein [Microcystis sp. M42BS1]|uniref:hypothetical protein n=1 Tax=Microcystis sp. M42BS1 TaxID=2771192 RepID=UPI0025872EFF|nr:hypothetical protein [Microcystis sp. M42BS1]MCA2570659.1 hypothetical protein [Microcystis sp. M42BS1]